MPSDIIGQRAHEFPLVWRWNARLPGRKGDRCRIIARASPARDETGKVVMRWNTILVEFTDGYRVATSGWAVRKAPEDFQSQEDSHV